MTEITRQHLEDAARAAGHEVACSEAEMHGCEDGSTVYVGLMLRGVQDAWRPHLDDGDSRRLQIAVGIILQPRVNRPACNAWLSGLGRPVHTERAQHDGTPADAARAARDAVVLCAAEVGRRMQEGGCRRADAGGRAMSKRRRFALCIAAACVGVLIYEFSPALWLVYMIAGIAAMPEVQR